LGKESLESAAAIENGVRKLVAPIFEERLKEVDATGVVYPGVRPSFIDGWSLFGANGVRLTQKEMAEAYEKIFTSDLDVSDVTLTVYGVVTDALGNETTQMVYATHMSKSGASMINWKNKDRLDFTKLWDTPTQDERWMKKK
jgi:hypothetical protein